MNDKTSGASLEANVSLIMENARVGAAMAVEIASLRRAYSRPVFPRSVAPQVLITTANGQTPAHLIRAAPVSKSSTLKPAPAKSTKSVSQSVVAAASDDLDSDGSSDLESELDLSDLESEIDEEDNGSDRRAPASKGASKSPDWFSAVGCFFQRVDAAYLLKVMLSVALHVIETDRSKQLHSSLTVYAEPG